MSEPLPTDPRGVLLSVLTAAYGSSARALVALGRALQSAGLETVPVAPAPLRSLVAHLRFLVEADLGALIAEALAPQVLQFVGVDEEQPPPGSGIRPVEPAHARSATQTARPGAPSAASAKTEHPISQLRLRKAPSIMLVRVGTAEETGTLDLGELAERVLRVRHPVPACERMRIMRPSVVIVGQMVADADLELLRQAARETGCELIELGTFVSQAALRNALRRAVDRAGRREGSDRPVDARAPRSGLPR